MEVESSVVATGAWKSWGIWWLKKSWLMGTNIILIIVYRYHIYPQNMYSYINKVPKKEKLNFLMMQQSLDATYFFCLEYF